MTHNRVTIRWPEGLHLRRAAKLVKVAQQFRSTIFLKCGDRIADLRSVLSVLALCATLGATLEIEVNGDDELEAARTVERVFGS